MGRARLLLLQSVARWNDPDVLHAMVSGVDASGAFHAAVRGGWADSMIECIFTLDYEIYGNGRGALDTPCARAGENNSESSFSAVAYVSSISSRSQNSKKSRNAARIRPSTW